MFLAVSDVNVITVCWRALARRNYATAVSGVPAVGRGVGQFLNFLHSVTGARFDQMHLTGLSLGAHVVGNAGRELGGKVARVTGKIVKVFLCVMLSFRIYFKLVTLIRCIVLQD